MDHHLFIDHQAATDMTVNVIAEAHTWEAMRDAVQRLADVLGAAPPLNTYVPLS